MWTHDRPGVNVVCPMSLKARVLNATGPKSMPKSSVACMHAYSYEQAASWNSMADEVQIQPSVRALMTEALTPPVSLRAASTIGTAEGLSLAKSTVVLAQMSLLLILHSSSR